MLSPHHVLLQTKAQQVPQAAACAVHGTKEEGGARGGHVLQGARGVPALGSHWAQGKGGENVGVGGKVGGAGKALPRLPS